MNVRRYLLLAVGLVGLVGACRTSSSAAREASPASHTAAAPASRSEKEQLAALAARQHPLSPLSRAVLAAIEKRQTPLLVYDLDQVAENYLRIRTALGGASILYAVKADPHPRILRRLVQLGSGFDAASRAEVEAALAAGSPPERISYGNTVKKAEDVRFAFQKGVRVFVVDAPAEVDKVARNAPGARVFARLSMGKTNAHYQLTGKFGVDVATARALLLRAKEKGLQPYGVSFHVGSQCYDAREWQEPLRRVAALFRDLMSQGIELQFINLGGGFPKAYSKTVPTVAEIGQVVRSTLAEELPGRRLTVAAEPGRYLVGDAALLASRVVLRAQRADAEWLHLDVGIYNGLNEAMYGIRYSVVTPGKSGPNRRFTLAGPTCDNADLIYKDIELSAALDENDLIIFESAGAYAASCSTSFNGFAPPAAVFLEDERP